MCLQEIKIVQMCVHLWGLFPVTSWPRVSRVIYFSIKCCYTTTRWFESIFWRLCGTRAMVHAYGEISQEFSTRYGRVELEMFNLTCLWPASVVFRWGRTMDVFVPPHPDHPWLKKGNIAWFPRSVLRGNRSSPRWRTVAVKMFRCREGSGWMEALRVEEDQARNSAFRD